LKFPYDFKGHTSLQNVYSEQNNPHIILRLYRNATYNTSSSTELLRRIGELILYSSKNSGYGFLGNCFRSW